MVALQHFCDNPVVAAKDPESESVMCPVCQALEKIWNLYVLCDCRAKDPTHVCNGTCKKRSITAMGVAIHVGDEDTLVFAPRNALGAQWQLKMRIHVRIFWARGQHRIETIFIGTL